MSQVNFFMLSEDERAFMQMLLDRGDTALIPARFFVALPPTLTEPPPFASTLNITLVNRSLSPKLRGSGRGDGPMKGKLFFDLMKDPACEMTPCHFEGEILIDGRIHSKLGYLFWEKDNVVHRSWYSAIERWVKKRYRRHRGWWLGPAAEEWSLAGGEICFGPNPAGLLVESLKNPKPV